jgi:hypothetical protein
MHRGPDVVLWCCGAQPTVTASFPVLLEVESEVFIAVAFVAVVMQSIAWCRNTVVQTLYFFLWTPEHSMVRP